MKLLHNGTALLMGLEQIDLKDYPKLKVIGCNCTGLDHLPLKEMEKRGIKLISLKSETRFLESIPATAEHTIGLILSLVRNISWAFDDVLSGFWNRESFIGHDLKGKTLLIVGHGRIGKMVEKYALSFGMKILTIDEKSEKLHKLLKKADIVTLHIPLEGNEGYFDKSCFDAMKKGAYFVNTSRGDIIDEKALLEALEGKLAGAALDVVQNEPNVNPNLIDYALDNDNLLLTPHTGGATFESMEMTETFIADKVKEYVKTI